jgi:methionyl-tRNA synthetase
VRSPELLASALRGITSRIERVINGSAARADTVSKIKEPSSAGGLDRILFTRRTSPRNAIVIPAVLAKAAHGIFDQLNWKMELSGKEERFALAEAEWGKLTDGHVVGKPVPLFPRIET